MGWHRGGLTGANPVSLTQTVRWTFHPLPPPSGRIHGSATREYAPLEAGFLSANSSAKAALLPFANLFARTC